jgi:hypothetical protein
VVVTLKIEAILSPETSVLTRAHGVISQKVAVFIITTMKPINLT